jgi:hypothetical protein
MRDVPPLCKIKYDRQHNGQPMKEKKTIIYKKTTQKTKDQAT